MQARLQREVYAPARRRGLLFLTFCHLAPLYFSDVAPPASPLSKRRSSLLRLLALLLVCLVAQVRALTLTPLVEGLNHPWGLVLLPDGGYLVGERPGRLLHIDAAGKRHLISGLPPLAATGQGGLLDLALDGDG